MNGKLREHYLSTSVVLAGILFFIMPVPGAAAVAGDTAEALNLTGHWAGIMALVIFILAYSLVVGEEAVHLRKSKPAVVAAGFIWMLVAIAYGKPIAHLVPAEAQERASRKRAVERFESWRAGWKGIDMSLEEILAVRRGHLSATRMNECLEALKWLPIQTDSEAVLEMVTSLARLHKLSVYDAVYLELAKRRDTALASLDAALLRAAAKEGVQVLDQ